MVEVLEEERALVLYDGLMLCILITLKSMHTDVWLDAGVHVTYIRTANLRKPARTTWRAMADLLWASGNYAWKARLRQPSTPVVINSAFIFATATAAASSAAIAKANDHEAVRSVVVERVELRGSPYGENCHQLCTVYCGNITFFLPRCLVGIAVAAPSTIKL